jgi:hypothetical protein
MNPFAFQNFVGWFEMRNLERPHRLDGHRERAVGSMRPA